ncbi:MAG: endo-1,4-beta-xylanase [Chloroflexi bacterium]|nr:endo-1,4-beta-xylanase [Chloroflexota bacterium]
MGPTRRFLYVTMTGLGLLSLTACSPSKTVFVPGPLKNLAMDCGWESAVPRAQVDNGHLLFVSSSTDIVAGYNSLRRHEVGDYFSITASMEFPGLSDDTLALQLYGSLPNDEGEMRRLDIALFPGKVEVKTFFRTEKSSFSAPPFSAIGLSRATTKAKLEVHKTPSLISVKVDGVPLGTVDFVDDKNNLGEPDYIGNIFPNDTGDEGLVYIGFQIPANSQLKVHDLRLVTWTGRGAKEVVTIAGQGRPSPRSYSARPTLGELARAKGKFVGSQVGGEDSAEEGDQRYWNVATEEFSIWSVVRFFPKTVHPERDIYKFCYADMLMDLAEANGIKIRATPLVPKELPAAWMNDLDDTQLTDVLREHIQRIVRRYKGRVYAWDVVNEAVADDGEWPRAVYVDGENGERPVFWLQRLGPSYIGEAFEWAHKADPDALLFYNDYGFEQNNEKRLGVMNLVSVLQLKGIPIHGVGLQMHLREGEEDPVTTGQAYYVMAKLAALSLHVHVTEMDVRIRSTPCGHCFARQARQYRNVLNACLKVDACSAFVTWGFTDRYSWIPEYSKGEYGRAAIFDDAMTPKPAYDSLMALLKEE